MDWIGFAIIFLTIVIIAISLLAEPFSKTVNNSIVVFVITLAIFLVFISGNNINIKAIGAEHYANDMTTTLDALSAFGNQTGGESIAKFASGLTIFYTAFTKSSYQRGTKTWINVSPNKQGGDQCPPPDAPSGAASATDSATFSEVPSFSKENGFPCGRNMIRGPMSYKLGISLNNSFTIAFTMRFDPFSKTVPDSNLELFKLFANTTSGLNGLSMYIQNDYSPVNDSGIGSDYNVNMFLVFGNRAPVKVTGLSRLSTSTIFMFVIIKTGLNLTLRVFPRVSEMSADSGMSSGFVGVDMQIPSSEDVMLSNKEFTINGQGNLQASIYNFAIWNKSLSSAVLNDWYMNTQIALQSGNATLTGLAAAYSEMQDQLRNANACPYDDVTCKTCNQVTNWNNVSDLILNGGPKCMASIDTFCTNNPTHPQCTCWNSSSALSDTEQCKTYKSMYKGAPTLSIDNLDSGLLNQIQNKYNLCECKAGMAADTSKQQQQHQETQQQQSIVPQLPMVSTPMVPRLINTLYTINNDDILAYNQIKVIGDANFKKENIDAGIFDSLLTMFRV